MGHANPRTAPSPSGRAVAYGPVAADARVYASSETSRIVVHMIDLEDIQAARGRVAGLIHRTPLVRSSTLSERAGTNVYLKLELFQKTGSFKPRGAFNQLRVLMDETGTD